MDNKLEQRGKYPATISQFKECAKADAWDYACVYGMEHYEGRNGGLEDLLAMQKAMLQRRLRQCRQR